MLIRKLVVAILTTYDGAGFEKAVKDQEEFTDAAKESEEQLEQLEKDIDKTGDTAATTGKQVKKAGKQIDKAGDQAQQTGKQASRMGNLMSKAATGIATAFATVGIEAVLAGIGKAVAFVGEKTAELDKIAKDAQKTGFGNTDEAVENFQRLAHVATLSGADVTVLAKGLGNLDKEIDKLAHGATTGPAAEAMADLGLSFAELQAQDPTEQLKTLSGALSGVEDEGQRSLLAFKLMGEEGKQLIPLFNSGADAVDKMAKSTGKVFTRAQLAEAEAYQDQMAGVDRQLDQLKGELALGVLPTVSKFTALMSDAIPPLIAFGSSIVDRIEPALIRLTEAAAPWVDRLGPEMGDNLGALVAPLEAGADAVGFLADKIAWLLEVGDEALTWLDETIDKVETRWPRAFNAAGVAVDALIHPLETARRVIGKIFDFIEKSASKVDGLSAKVASVRASLGLGGDGPAPTIAPDPDAPATNFPRSTLALAPSRAADAAARAAFEAQKAAETSAPRRRRGGGGGGGRSSAPAEAPSGGFLDELGLTGPGAVMEKRPAPNTMTLIISTVINLMPDLTITIEGNPGPELRNKMENAAQQARDVALVTLGELPGLVDAILSTRVDDVRTMSGGGQTRRGMS